MYDFITFYIMRIEKEIQVTKRYLVNGHSDAAELNLEIISKTINSLKKAVIASRKKKIPYNEKEGV